MKEHLRNRYKLYPAPKAVITAEAFKKAVVSRRRAEALLHVQAQAAALERLQVGAQPSADLGNTDAGPALANGDAHPGSSDAVPMAMDEEPPSMPTEVRPAPDLQRAACPMTPCIRDVLVAVLPGSSPREWRGRH